MAASGVAGTGTHTVKPGETASKIAADHGTTVEALAAANGLRDPNLVVIGATLVIPGGGAASDGGTGGTSAGSYTVKPGDTLSSIAAASGTNVDALAKANGITDPHRIFVGRIIKLAAAASGGGSSSSTGLPARLLARPERLALRPTFEKWAAHYGVPADLVESLAWMESGWQNSVVSSTNAVGIGQLMPDTVDFVQLLIGDQRLDPTVPEQNIRMTVRFLRYLLDQTGGDAATSLAAYYQGLQSIRTRPWYEDTKQYVAVILALRPRFA